MGKLLFWGMTGVLALIVLGTHAGVVSMVFLGAVLGPAGIFLGYGILLLPALWLAGASFALAYAATGWAVSNQILRVLASCAVVALAGYVVFIALPNLTASRKANHAASILAQDIAAPAQFAPVRSIEIRLLGDQSGKATHFGPGDCYDLCVDLLAAGVIDRVTFYTHTRDHSVSRETVQSGCRSNLFGRKKQGRAFRLHLAGYCLVSTPLTQGMPTAFTADITFVMTSEIAGDDSQFQQVQAYDKNGKLLLQQSHLKWTTSPPRAALDWYLSAPFGPSSMPVIRHEAGRSPVPYGWPAIAAVLGLQSTQLRDSTLNLPQDTDPAAYVPPDVSFRMLELLAQSGTMTDSERIVFAAITLRLNWMPSEQTAVALQAVLAARPDFGGPIARSLQAKMLRLVETDDFPYDPNLLRDTVIALQDATPVADLPPVLAGLRDSDLTTRAAASLALAEAAIRSGAPAATYLRPILQRFYTETTRFRTDAPAVPEIGQTATQALNAAICRHAENLPNIAGDWLAWASAHAAIAPQDRAMAADFGVTAAHLGLDPKQVAQAFATSAAWTPTDTITLAQSADTPCPR